MFIGLSLYGNPEFGSNKLYCVSVTVTHFIGDWLDPRARLDMEKRKFMTLSRLELRPLGRPARSQSLFRLLPVYRYYCYWAYFYGNFRDRRVLIR
jgi:hypothetical protein